MKSSAGVSTLLIATRNAHKVAEIRAILGSLCRYRTLNDFPDAPKIVEDAATFAGNASKKAKELARWLREVSNLRMELPRGTFVLADDSGLVVDALDGAPGIHSARFAALDEGRPGNSSDAENNAKLLRLLEGVPLEERAARFRCVLALTPVGESPAESAPPVRLADELDPHTELFEGVCEGRIQFEPRGAGGFGYDPLFIPQGYEQSFAELSGEIKNRLSHRARALMELRKRLDPAQAGESRHP